MSESTPHAYWAMGAAQVFGIGASNGVLGCLFAGHPFLWLHIIILCLCGALVGLTIYDLKHKPTKEENNVKTSEEDKDGSTSNL